MRYLNVPQELRNSLDFWLGEMSHRPKEVLINYNLVPETVRQNVDFWIAGITMDAWEVFKYVMHGNYVPESVKNNLELWIAFWKTPYSRLKESDILPVGVRTDKEFWTRALELDLECLTQISKVPDGVFNLMGLRRYWRRLVDDKYQFVLYNYHNIPNGVFAYEERKMHWIGALEVCPNIIFSRYDHISERIKGEDEFKGKWNDPNFWIVMLHILKGMDQNYIIKFAGEDRLPQTVKTEKRFWVELLREFPVSLGYFSIPLGIFTSEEQRVHWEEALRREPRIVLWESDKIPWEIFSEEERVKHWLNVHRDSEFMRCLEEHKLPSVVTNNKMFWSDIFKKDMYILLRYYKSIPENLFTVEEQRTHWLEGLSRYSLLSLYPNIPETVKNDPEFITLYQGVMLLLHLFDNKFDPIFHKHELPAETATLISSVRSLAKEMRIEGDGGRTYGLEIEVDNNEEWERRFGPTNDKSKLYFFLSQVRQLMEISSSSGNILDKSYYWNVHLNIGINRNERQTWSDGYHINRTLEDLVHLSIFPSNTLMRNLYNLHRLHTRNLVFMKEDISTTLERPEVVRIEIKEGSISGLTDTLYLNWVWSMIEHAIERDEEYVTGLIPQLMEVYRGHGLPITRLEGRNMDDDKRILEELNQSGIGQRKMRMVRQDVLEIILEELHQPILPQH